MDGFTLKEAKAQAERLAAAQHVRDNAYCDTILDRGVAAWNDWREKNPEFARPFLGAGAL
jgi:hypothetical protein